MQFITIYRLQPMAGLSSVRMCCEMIQVSRMLVVVPGAPQVVDKQPLQEEVRVRRPSCEGLGEDGQREHRVVLNPTRV